MNPPNPLTDIGVIIRPVPRTPRDVVAMFEDMGLPPFERGLFNGYISLYKGHPWYGLDYGSIPADVHGGLTYAQEEPNPWNPDAPPFWVIGFDTSHGWDTPERWNLAAVMRETASLHAQAVEAGRTVEQLTDP